MTDAQQKSIIRVSAILCRKFGLEVNEFSIVYHHWFNLGTGERNDGRESNKPCPGTLFFGGNKVPDFKVHFQPKVIKELQTIPDLKPERPLLSYAVITAQRLNVRSGPHYKRSLAKDREPIPLGSIVRVFEVATNGWVRISSSKAHWVSGKYINSVRKGTVHSEYTTGRLGPGEEFEGGLSHVKGEVLFFEAEKNSWHRIKMGYNWIHEDDLSWEVV